MTVRELLTKIGFEVDEKPLNQVEEKLDQIKERLELFAAAEILKGLFEVTERFAHLGEELSVAAQAAGITTAAFQKLAYAAQQNAVSQDEMQHGLAILSRYLYEAKKGTKEAADAFRHVGISSEQIKGFKTSQDALYALADRFSKMKDPIAKMGAAQELLGRGGYQMVAFLSKGSKAMKDQGDEAERLGLILSGPQVQALEDVEHAFQRLFLLLKTVGASIASYIGPAFTFLVDKFIEFFKVNKDVVNINLSNWLNTVAYGMGFITGLAFALTQKMINLAKAFHLEGAILPTIAGLASAVLGFITFVKTANMVIHFVREMATAWEVLVPVLKAVRVFATEAMLPFLPWVAAIAAVILVGHELYALFTGKPTWIGQFWEWLKSLNAVKVALSWISDTWDKLKNGSVGEFFARAGNFFGIGNGNSTPEEKLARLNSPAGMISSISNSTNTVGGTVSIEVNSPITITVPHGTDTKVVAAQVKEGVKEHFARVAREIQRSTANPVAH